MTRRPLIIAAVVTVAALACVVPLWEDVWLWVAYEEKVSAFGVRYFSKRWGWDYYVPPGQICDGYRLDSFEGDDHHCGQVTGHETHTLRLSGYRDGRTLALGIGVSFEFDCTCPTCHPERER